jgi:DNA-binding MarR family transcriptional regulator
MTASPRAQRESVAAAVDAVSRWIDRRRRAMVKDMHACGQSPAQLHVLGLLNEMGPSTVSHIAMQLGVTPPSASAIVDRMVDGGLVDRQRSEEDRRVVTVSLAAAGRDALQASVGGRRGMLERVLSQLSDEELRDTVRLMGRLEEAINQAKGAPIPG